MPNKIRTNKNVCLFCFGDLDLQRNCLQCGKQANDVPNLSHHLPKRTVLNKRYLIVNTLGEGGFGITYLVWDLTTNTKIAIKEYYPNGYVNRVPKSYHIVINSKKNQEASNRGLKRFIDEAKALAKVKNLSGIVSVKDFFSENGTAYIAMEFLDGISLKKYVQQRGGRISMDETLDILHPVLDSLIFIHRMNLIHRDISPDNIIITKHNEVKLIDFGATNQSDLEGNSLSIVLKQGFAPEEQYRTNGEQGPWTDIYAIGVSIYYCITGKIPPESINRTHIDSIIKPSEQDAIISPTQETALMKSLAVYAKNRYQNVEQLITGLYGIKVENNFISNTITNKTSNTTTTNEKLSIHPPIKNHNDITLPSRLYATREFASNSNHIPKTLEERRKEIAENRSKKLREIINKNKK
ncbi:MAG: serine/threonine protein kinase [Firmicutes bacterium]|nr:serine/threonine protein kinase [Bacillota bacterium]